MLHAHYPKHVCEQQEQSWKFYDGTSHVQIYQYTNSLGIYLQPPLHSAAQACLHLVLPVKCIAFFVRNF